MQSIVAAFVVVAALSGLAIIRLARQVDRYRQTAHVLAGVLREHGHRESLGASGRVLFYEIRDEHHEALRLLPLDPTEADELAVLRAGLAALGRRR